MILTQDRLQLSAVGQYHVERIVQDWGGELPAFGGWQILGSLGKRGPMTVEEVASRHDGCWSNASGAIHYIKRWVRDGLVELLPCEVSQRLAHDQPAQPLSVTVAV